MLELKEYSCEELCGQLSIAYGKNASKNLQAKMERNNIGFTVKGRGRSTTFTITVLPVGLAKFRLFCEEKYQLAPQTQFKEFRDFVIAFFTNEDYQHSTLEMWEQHLREINTPVSRQTLAKYLETITSIGEMEIVDYYYYLLRNIGDGLKEQEEIPYSVYKEAWAFYFSLCYQGWATWDAYSMMISKYNGSPRKKPIYASCAWSNKAEELLNIAIDTMEEDNSED